MFKNVFLAILVLTGLSLGAVACGTGTPGDLCFSDFDCDEGLICLEGICQ